MEKVKEKKSKANKEPTYKENDEEQTKNAGEDKNTDNSKKQTSFRNK